MNDCLSWEGPHAGVGEECEQEGMSETKCDELTATPIPCHLCVTLQGGGRRVTNEVEPGRMWGEEEVFSFHFCFSLSCSIFNCQ